MRVYGNPDGIGRRCAAWANQLSRDKKYPWVGTGLIDDLKCVAKMHGIDYDKEYPLIAAAPPPPVVEEDEFAHFQPSPPEDVEPEEDEFAHFQPSAPMDFDL